MTQSTTRGLAVAVLLTLLAPGLALAKGNPRVNALEARIATLESSIPALENKMDQLVTSVDTLADLLVHFSRTGDEVAIEGANLTINNGAGTTDSINGLGNVIIGYNETVGASPDRSGSHNLVLGMGNAYSSYAGIASGQLNAIEAPYACTIGGSENVASGDFAVAVSGIRNTASGPHSVITAGRDGVASGDASTVGGGSFNTASGDYSVVSGGADGIAPGLHDWVAGSLFEDN